MRRLPMMLSMCLCVACSAERGTSLQIQNAPAPDTSCAYVVSPDKYIGRGFYDPHGYAGIAPSSFHLGLLLRNNMIAGSKDPATSFGRDVRTSANDVEIIGFNVCWDLASRYSSFGNEGELPFKCGSLPDDQRGFVSTSAWIAANAGQTTVSVDILSLVALQAGGIFGPNFFPQGLEEFDRNVTTVPQPPFSLPLVDAACGAGSGSACSGTRSANWGDFPYDVDNTARLLVLLQAVGRNQSGGGVRSNWFSYPIDVCVGCLTYACGVPEYTQCTDAAVTCADASTPTCGDGSTASCASGNALCTNSSVPTCTNGSNASCVGGTTAWVGEYLDLTNSCLPFQGVDPKCLTLACP